MIKRWIDTVTALAPFLEAYPSWVKVLICAWVLFSAIILAIIFLALLFARKSPVTKRDEPSVTAERDRSALRAEHQVTELTELAGC